VDGGSGEGDRGPSGGRSSLKRYRVPGLVGLVVIAGAAAAVIALSSGGSSKPPVPAGQRFATAAQPVPTNHVTGNGTANIALNGNSVAVTLNTNGLLNGAPHALHIHAGGAGVCPPASAAKLHNGHLSIATLDGIKFYGPPQVSMTLFGDTSPKSIVDFSRYPTVGNIRYQRTITVPPGVAGAIRAGNAVIVVHGIDYDGKGVYDNVLDRSDLNPSLPGTATAPALCGTLVPTTATASTGRERSSVTTYAVVLRRYVASVATRASILSLLCHLGGSTPTPAIDPRASAGSIA
jgi:hypothetical protein